MQTLPYHKKHCKCLLENAVKAEHRADWSVPSVQFPKHFPTAGPCPVIDLGPPRVPTGEETPNSPSRDVRRAAPLFYTGVSCLKRMGLHIGGRFWWATVGCGNRGVPQFISRCCSIGESQLSCAHLTHKAQPASGQKVTILQGTSHFLPWLPSGPFPTRSVPNPHTDNSYHCFFTIPTPHASSDVKEQFAL